MYYKKNYHLFNGQLDFGFLTFAGIKHLHTLHLLFLSNLSHNFLLVQIVILFFAKNSVSLFGKI